MFVSFINVCFRVSHILILADERGCKYLKGKKKDYDDDIAEVSLGPPQEGKRPGFENWHISE